MLEIIKVCGITQPADALAAVEAGATAIGFIFYAESPRAVRIAQAAMIGSVVPPTVLKVGIFVNESLHRMLTVADAARLDVVQLHGDEGPETAAALAGFRVWQAFRVGDDFEASVVDEFPVEAVLLDSAGNGYGGAGRTFPWQKALEVKRYREVILAGGLAADNVAEAIRQVDPWGVDASSRLESRPGEKDAQKVSDYVAAARALQGAPDE